MTEQTTPMAALHEGFDRARGVPMDGVWAHAVSWRLLRRDVEPDQVCEGLEEALALVRETQESPEKLFGTPEEHSDALYDRWVDEGRLHLWDTSSMTWRDVPAWGLGIASFVSLASMVVLLADGRTSLTWTPGWVLLPVGMGVATAVGWATWDTLLRARGTAVAVVGTLGAIAACAATLALAQEWANAVPLGTASTWSYLWLAAGFALLAAAAARWADARPTPAPAIADVDDWSRQVGAILRGRHHLADARVAKIIGDAHAIAADAGHTVQEECGTPQEFAAGFVPDHTRQRRIEATLWAIMAVGQGVWLLGDVDWFRAAVVTACLVLAWRLLHRDDEEEPQSGR